MSRLSIITPSQAQTTVESLYKDLERRIIASPPGLCPVDMAASFLKLCHAQTCGKCTPCRIGLAQLGNLLDDVLSGNADMDTLQLIEDTAQTIYDTADCAIGYEAANMVLKGVHGFRDDYIEHIQHNRCTATLNQPVPCVSQCPAHVDIPGYIALVNEGRYDDAVRLIRQDNPFVTTCAFICEHPCENRCRRNMLDDSVNIRGIKRFAADHISNDYVPALAEPTGKKVAVIGGGPGGLSAAYYLSIMGHKVTVFEQRD
ncbi:MAG: NAD(P)-binding protein, partial [Firmicutes bacterium]|nr:NAD(P)-binding protein [Bacillota bacterium]